MHIAVGHAAYSEANSDVSHSEVEVDVEAAPRPTVVDEIRATIRQLKRLQGIKGEGFIDAVLRGLGQVVFQNNPLTGLLGPTGNQREFVRLRWRGTVRCRGQHLYGNTPAHRQQAGQGRTVRLQRRVDSHRDGRLQQQRKAHGDLPSALMILYVALAAGFSTILARAFAFMIRNDRVPGLNFPYCVATLLLLGALHRVQRSPALDVGHALPSPAHQVYASDTWLYGIAPGSRRYSCRTIG